MADLPRLVKGGQEPTPNLIDIGSKILLKAIGEIFANALKLVDDSNEREEAIAQWLVLKGQSFHFL